MTPDAELAFWMAHQHLWRFAGVTDRMTHLAQTLATSNILMHQLLCMETIKTQNKGDDQNNV